MLENHTKVKIPSVEKLTLKFFVNLPKLASRKVGECKFTSKFTSIITLNIDQVDKSRTGQMSPVEIINQTHILGVVKGGTPLYHATP